ncbi:uncharacterized protein LOC123551303 [Mercenaria mercenaria]|uniref:uncharacterized protein LOC123551303 n=1 Tax=Mercenaria mercenaria TaxID=6596 RepID=UPI00234EAA85|nr:uncharacterized protein LOC123551303 [Mercenaria mercenaria]
MSGLFRCAGDILFDDHQPLPGQISNVQLKKFSETSNFLQLKQPLTPEHPYFFAQIRSLAQQSRITLGIAGPDIDNDAHPGHWNNTVGFHSDTGKCFSSHNSSANTKGEKFSIGDMFGVMVTYFGEGMSTVLFIKNGVPVATRYLFEPDNRKFLPTLCLENGPIDLGIMWPQAAIGIPKFDERNMLNWIKDDGMQYDSGKNLFTYDQKNPEVTLQSPVPLTKDLVHYEMIVMETLDGESPAVGLATCSPLMPTPTCVLLRDFFRWKAEGKDLQVHVGQRIGFGIHYSPEEVSKPDFDDKKQQLVLCFVTMDMQIVFFRMMMQPPGGFYPLIVMTRAASKVSLDLETNRDLGQESTRALLDDLYQKKLPEALEVVQKDNEYRELSKDMFRKSDDISIEVEEQECVVSLPKDKRRIHAIQFNCCLNPQHSYFCAQIVKLNEDSVVSIGVGDSNFPLTKHPGKCAQSTGYVSREGKMYCNEKSGGNIEGERFNEGDIVGLDVTTFNENGSSIVLFIKNDRPVGMRYVTINCDDLMPTISMCGNGYDVCLHVFWQNRLSDGPNTKFFCNLKNWCLPSDSEVDEDSNTVIVKDHLKPISIQCPEHLNEFFNHFEMEILDEFGGSHPPPPVIALSSAATKDNSHLEEMSNFRIDYLRFWAVGEAEQSVKVGDLVGWGMLIPKSQMNKEDRMVICYLTINRNIALTRVMFEPPGGLYPIVILPNDVNRVKLEFSAVHITKHPISDELVDKLLSEAEEIYEREQEFLQANKNKDIDDFELDRSALLKPLPQQTDKNSGESDKHVDKSEPKLRNVVMKAKGIDSVQKAVKNYRDNQQMGHHSKACVIL